MSSGACRAALLLLCDVDLSYRCSRTSTSFMRGTHLHVSHFQLTRLLEGRAAPPLYEYQIQNITTRFSTSWLFAHFVVLALVHVQHE